MIMNTCLSGSFCVKQHFWWCRVQTQYSLVPLPRVMDQDEKKKNNDCAAVELPKQKHMQDSQASPTKRESMLCGAGHRHRLHKENDPQAGVGRLRKFAGRHSGKVSNQGSSIHTCIDCFTQLPLTFPVVWGLFLCFLTFGREQRRLEVGGGGMRYSAKSVFLHISSFY